MKQRKKILIVDRDKDNQLATMLREEGYEVLHAKSTPQCMGALETEDIGLIILDIMLPDMLGFTLLNKIKFNPETSQVPVIMTSGATIPFYENKAYVLGAKYYLNQPYRKEQALGIIQKEMPCPTMAEAR
jgi:CheY-like chemotaxis protein